MSLRVKVAFALTPSSRPRMLAYNVIHWDWCHLGLADLLDAMTTEALPARSELGETSSFYAWVMRIASSQPEERDPTPDNCFDPH